MKRHAAAIAVALCLSVTRVSAQTTEPQSTALTVKTAASIHKSPTVASAVVGTAPRGTVLEVKRNLGSWIEVPWTEGEKGVGYIHVNAGTITRGAMPDPRLSAGAPQTPSSPTAASQTPLGAVSPAEQIAISDRAGSSNSVYVSLPRHIVGLGGRMSETAPGFGATFRGWWRNRLGVQFEMSRYRFDSVGAPGYMTSVQFAPSVLYSLPDSVTDALWVRPYVGGGGSLYRSTLSGPTGSVTALATEKGLGFQAFGGAEATIAGMPRFALSADVGYRWSHTTLGGLEPNKIGFALAGHWYLK